MLFTVQKPREQLADAEALLDIANSLVTSVKSHGNNEATPSDFVTSLLRNFGQDGERGNENSQALVSWADVGLTVSRFIKMVPGCCTMYYHKPFLKNEIKILVICLF